MRYDVLYRRAENMRHIIIIIFWREKIDGVIQIPIEVYIFDFAVVNSIKSLSRGLWTR